MITIQGKGVSAGVGVGPLYYYRRATAEIKRYTVEDTDAEWHRFKGAQTGAVEQLGQLEAAGFVGAAFMDKDEIKIFAQQ